MPFDSISALSRNPELLREWFQSGLCAVLLLLAAGQAVAQDVKETPAPAPTTTAAEPAPAAPAAPATNQTAAISVTNAPAAINAAPTTNTIAVTNSAPATVKPPPTAKAAAPVSPTSYEAFKLIAERNIFNPNRYPQRARSTDAPPPPKPQPKVEAFALVGTISYEQGAFAFFDSNNPAYRKTLKSGDAIASYKLKDVSANAVTLETEGKEVELKVGMQMRREDDGPWLASVRTETISSPSLASSESSSRVFGRSTAARSSDGDPAGAGASVPASAPAGDSGGGASELLKRLMEQRQKELTP